MRTAARQAADYVVSQSDNLEPVSWSLVDYDWDKNELNIRVSFTVIKGNANHEECNRIRSMFISHLFGWGSIQHDDKDSDWFKNWSRDYSMDQIRYWFDHEGFRKSNSSEEKGPMLSEIIFVETVLFSNGSDISCRDRVMADNAPSKPNHYLSASN